MMKNHTEVIVSTLPPCWFCEPAQLAAYDGKTRQGPWAYMCEAHFAEYGIGLGLGRGQKLVMK